MLNNISLTAQSNSVKQNPPPVCSGGSLSIPVEDTVCLEQSGYSEPYDVLLKLRKGDPKAKEMMKEAIRRARSGRIEDLFKNNTPEDIVIRQLALHYNSRCVGERCACEYDVYNYPGIHRGIGEEEYDALLRGGNIVSLLRGDAVDVTNEPKEGWAEGAAYRVKFKLEPELDAFLSTHYSRKWASRYVDVQGIPAKHKFLLIGGYSLQDVEYIQKGGYKGEIVYAANLDKTIREKYIQRLIELLYIKDFPEFKVAERALRRLQEKGEAIFARGNHELIETVVKLLSPIVSRHEATVGFTSAIKAWWLNDGKCIKDIAPYITNTAREILKRVK